MKISMDRPLDSLPKETAFIHRNISLNDFLGIIKDFVIEISPKGERKALLQLEPPELGKMELDIRVHDGEVEINLKVEKQEAFNHFQQEFSQIRQQIEDLGLKVREFQISLGLSTSQERSFSKKERDNTFKSQEGKIGGTEPLENNVLDVPFYHGGRLYRIV